MEQPTPISNQTVRQVFFILILVLLGGIVFMQLKNLLPAFLGAYTLYILLRKMMDKLTKLLRGWRKTSALIIIVTSLLIDLFPLNGLVNLLSSRIKPAMEHSNDIWGSFEKGIKKIEDQLNISILTQDNIKSLSDWGISEMQQILGFTFNSLLIVVVMYFILFFMLVERGNMEKAFYDWLPLRTRSTSLLKKNLNELVLSNAIGIPLVAIIQGLFAWVGYYFAGVQEPFIWFIATCVAAMIPVLGAALVYVPLSIVLFANNMTTQAAMLLLYGFLVIGTVDNLFRFWLQDKLGDTHPLITIFGVIIGLQLFGFIGLIFGPILISLLLLLVHIYKHEFHADTE